MTKIDIFSGFLGAGKTTLIKKLIAEAFQGEKIVLIENEFGEIGIDGGFLKEAGIEITEMNSGCICCSLVGDFREALKQVISQYHPDRILIEPSGVGKLSDVTRAVEAVADESVKLNSFVTVADVNKVKLYIKNFGEFYNDQVSHANAIVLSRTGKANDEKIAAAVALLKEKNPEALIITTDWAQLSGEQIIHAMESKDEFVQKLLAEARAHADEEDEEEDECCCGHDHDHDHEHEHHHHYDENGVCSCGHHHHDDEEEEHEHHHHHDHECHHDHDHDEHEHHHDHEHCDHDHEHEHHHHYDENGVCSCGHHHHHHHHHADEVFTSWGVETIRKYTKAELEFALQSLDSGELGTVLRAKGIVAGVDGWFQFDYVPGEYEVREGGADVTGRLCVIGSELKEHEIAELFHI